MFWKTIILLGFAFFMGWLIFDYEEKDPMDAVVVIHSNNPLNKTGAKGSGFAIDDKIIVTNHHVIEMMGNYGVIESIDGKIQKYEILGENEDLDLAVLRVASDVPEKLNVSCERPERGRGVSAIGNPLYAKFSEYKGYIASDDFMPKHPHFIFLDLGVNSGLSGSALIDNDTKNVVGVISAMMVQEVDESISGSHTGIAVSGDVLCGFLKQNNIEFPS